MVSTNPKSQPGKNGQDSPLPDNEKLQNSEKSYPSPEPVSKSGPAPALPAVVSVKRKPHKSGKIFLNESDKKIVRNMTKEISKRLNLNSKSRSFIV